MVLSIILGALSVLLAALFLATRARNRALSTELSSLYSALETRATLSDELLATVSHELRTPLTSIRGALGLLAGGLNAPDPHSEKLFRIALSNTDRLTRLINALLDLEHMESGSAPLLLHRCDLAALVREALDSMTAQAETAGVALQLDPALCFLSFPVHADADRILQVLTNLLSNAIKFSPAGSSIRVAARAAGGTVQLSVADEGRGIPADKLEAVFQRFHQVEPDDNRKRGGAGLGLAICRAIAQQHGGSISAASNQPLPGVTFHLHLPAETGAPSAAAIPRPQQAALSA